MFQSLRRRGLSFVVVMLASIGALGLSAAGSVIDVVQPDPVAAAWRQARTAGSYRFTSDIVQVTIPRSAISNVGRTSQTDQLHLEGHTNLRQQSLELQLWTDGGSVAQAGSGLGVRVANGKT